MYVFITCGGIKSVGTHWKWKRDICFRKYIRRWVFVILLGIIHAYMAIYIAHKYLGIYENMCIGLTVKLFSVAKFSRCNNICCYIECF